MNAARDEVELLFIYTNEWNGRKDGIKEKHLK